MSSIIAEPYWQKLWRMKKIAEVKKKLKQAKKEGNTAKVAYYEVELMLLSVEDHVIH